jgi:hypothetical protein
MGDILKNTIFASGSLNSGLHDYYISKLKSENQKARKPENEEARKPENQK